MHDHKEIRAALDNFANPLALRMHDHPLLILRDESSHALEPSFHFDPTLN